MLFQWFLMQLQLWRSRIVYKSRHQKKLPFPLTKEQTCRVTLEEITKYYIGTNRTPVKTKPSLLLGLEKSAVAQD